MARRRKRAAFFVVIIVGVFFVFLFGRRLVHRPSTPKDNAAGGSTDEDETALVEDHRRYDVKTWSFPSGHATSSMIFYLTLALAIAPRGWRRAAATGAILLSLLIGLSRVMLGVHWPSDVVGGWCFGLLWVLLTLRPAERLFRDRNETRISARQEGRRQ